MVEFRAALIGATVGALVIMAVVRVVNKKRVEALFKFGDGDALIFFFCCAANSATAIFDSKSLAAKTQMVIATGAFAGIALYKGFRVIKGPVSVKHSDSHSDTPSKSN
jgi:hypothetical protein